LTAPRAAIGDFGAAGALAAAAAALAVASDRVPPTRGLVGAAPHGLDVVRDAARALPIRVAVVDGLARGGACRPLRLEAAA
jgi:3-oxoacyl-(acyl-carrier-protein) synthase